MDIVVVALLTVAFAWAVTMHVVLTIGLAQRRPRWRALVGLVILPCAPYWAWRERMHKRVWLWGIGVLVYLVALALSFR